MSTRSYNQICGVARALDLLGERWTMLIIRELLLGPKRFGALRSTLEGIGPDSSATACDVWSRPGSQSGSSCPHPRRFPPTR